MKYLRPIYVLLHGPSIELLDRNIEHFREHNVDWGSLNRFSILEEKILSKINKRFDIIYVSSEERFEQEKDNITNHKGLLITNHQIAINHGITKGALVSSFGYGFSSLFAMLVSLMKVGYPKIYLFGADGYAENKDNVYFGQECYDGEDFKARQNSIARDTEFMNKYFWELTDYWGIKKSDIINVGLNSKITCFPKISIMEIM